MVSWGWGMMASGGGERGWGMMAKHHKMGSFANEVGVVSGWVGLGVAKLAGTRRVIFSLN